MPDKDEEENVKHFVFTMRKKDLHQKNFKELNDEFVKLIEKEFADEEENHMIDKLHIQTHFYYDNNPEPVGTDTIECINVVPFLLKIKENRRETMHESGYVRSIDTETGREDYEESIRWNDQSIENAKYKMEQDEKLGSDKENWYDSRYWRRFLTQHPELSYKEIADLYSPGPINFRRQTAQTGDRTEKWLRIGVVTDLTNGWTSLKRLYKLQKMDPVEREKAIAILIDELRQKIEPPKIKKIGSKLKSLVGIKPKENRIDKRKREAIEYAIAEFQNLDATISKRYRILRDQMLILTIFQVMDNKNKIDQLHNGDVFTFAHAGLLNELNRSFDVTGWAHNEDFEMEDMYQIFKDFQGKKVFFKKGVDVPTLDKDGNIIMGKKDDNGPDEITINPIFLNTTVQGNKKNTKIQAEINAEAFEALSKIEGWEDNPFFRKAIEILNQNKSNFDASLYICLGFIDLKIPFSIGCLSAKDRTGFEGEFILRWLIKNYVLSQKPLTKREKAVLKKFIKDLNNGVLNRDIGAAKVIGQNTGANIIKSTDTLQGELNPVDPRKRGVYFLKQAHINEPLA